MLRVALRPRFLGLLALMVAATVACGLLASWQWDRAHRALSDRDAGPTDRGAITALMSPGDVVTNEISGDTVSASGRYAEGEQVIVPGREIEETDAVIVVTALLIEQEDGTTARLPVARGWVPATDVTGPDGALDASLAPPPPAGEQQIQGRLEASESATGGVTAGIASEIATPLLVNEWGSPMYAGFVALQTPGEGLSAMPDASSRFSRGLDWQNIGYSFQWVLFGGFFLYLWWRTVRTAYHDELADQREAVAALATAPDSAESADASPSTAPSPSTDSTPQET